MARTGPSYFAIPRASDSIFLRRPAYHGAAPVFRFWLSSYQYFTAGPMKRSTCLLRPDLSSVSEGDDLTDVARESAKAQSSPLACAHS